MAWRLQKRSLRRWLRDTGGIAYVEFALSTPVMLLLFLGSIEMTRYILTIQKLEKTVDTIADVVAQTDPRKTQVTTVEMQQLMSATTDMMSPYSRGSNDPNIIVIVTDVYGTPNNPNTNPPIPTVKWQYCGGGGGTLTNMNVHSKLTPTHTGASAIGSTANISGVTSPFGTAGFALTNNEEMLVGEVYYNYTPLLTNPIISSNQIYRKAVYMPRLGALTSFSSTCS